MASGEGGQMTDPEFQKALEALGEHVPRFMADKGLFDHSDRIYLQAQLESERQRQEAQQKQEQDQLELFRVQALKPPTPPALSIPAKPSKLVADKPLNKIVIRKRVQGVVKKEPTKRPKLEHSAEEEDRAPSPVLPIASYRSDSDTDAAETKNTYR